MKKTRIFLAILLILALFTFVGCTNKNVDLNPDNGTDNGVVDNDLNNDGVDDNYDNTVNDLDNDGINNNGDALTEGAITENDAKNE